MAMDLRRPRASSHLRFCDLGLVLSFVALSAVAKMRLPVGGADEGLLLVYAEQLNLGRTPNLDFFTVYGPGGYRVLAAMFAWAGPTLVAERTVALAYHAASSLA